MAPFGLAAAAGGLLLDRLHHWAQVRAAAPALVYLADAEHESDRLDYATLAHRVEALAAALRQHAAGAGPVLVATRSELLYLIGLLACLLAGRIAIPTLVPTNERAVARIRAHGEDAKAQVLLADAWVLERRSRLDGAAGAWLQGLTWLDLEQAGRERTASESGAGPRAGDVAYLQYTSGSTDRPKGVMVTHGNLAAQLSVLETALGHRPGEVVCNWMPLHHDFGLVMSLQALYSGATAVLLPPVPAVQRPERWLRALARYRAVTSAAPNFMFDRCAERVAQTEPAAGDLSGLRNLLNAAEPIQPAAVRAFEARFAGRGFRPSMWRASFGLAEATLMVSMAPPHGGCRIERFDAAALQERRVVPAADGRELVSCGVPLAAGSVVIVDPATLGAVAPDRVGEIWVACASVAAGYWGRPAETAADFAAHRSDSPGGPAYLRTGDLGFLRDGELFIAGRLKDLVIVRGENHYPQDIEHSVSAAHPDLEPNAAAAFAEDGPHGEVLVVVCELRREAHRRVDAASVFAAVRHAVAQAHGLECEHVVLLRPNGLPRTSSGKVQRRACRRDWQEGRLPVVAQWQKAQPGAGVDAGSGLQQELLDCCRALLGVAQLDPQASLFDYGLDSLKAAELLLLLEERWQLTFDLADLAERVSVARLAEAIGRRAADAAPPARAHRAQASTLFLGDQGEGPAADAGGLLARVGAYVRAWDGSRVRPDSLLVGRNTAGSRPPLFWVFQGQQEWANLAERLGPEQPVHGLRSGHEVMDYTEANVQALATAYRREIEAVRSQGAYLLGGNCQGGLIAMAIAQQFWRLQQPVALLALLEWAFPPQPYVGRVALLWGEASRQKNPFFRFGRPELLWQRIYGAYSVDLIPGAHGEFFSGPGLAGLAACLERRMAESLAVAPLLLPAGAQLASCRVLAVPSQVAAGERFTVQAAVRNTSGLAWGAQAGLRVANHWLAADGNLLQWLDGAADLGVVAPGAEVVVEFCVRAPREPGWYLLQVDVVEEGVGWVSERGVAPASGEVLVVAG